MRKSISIGLMAATMIPGAASAAQISDARHPGAEVRRDMRHDIRQQARQARRHTNNWTAYAAPVHNWRYRPVTVGFRLQPTFYGSTYYVSDYGMYHLRAPRRFQQWIRYGDDLLLVNVRTGRVLQVIHNRYW